MNVRAYTFCFLYFVSVVYNMGVAQYTATHKTGYVTPSVTMPLYGAGFTEGAAAPDDDRLRRIEEKLDKLIDLLTKLAADPAPEAQAQADLAFRQLPQEDETMVARKVEKGQMPPPESGAGLTPEEKKAFVDLYRHRKLSDQDAAKAKEVLSVAAGKCVACHSPTVDYKKKGGGFLLFDLVKK